VKNNSQPEKQLKNKQRRDFIKKSTIVGAGVASTEKPGQQGYQLTQHVLDYYKSADI
jgi:hypothetical protein